MHLEIETQRRHFSFFHVLDFPPLRAAAADILCRFCAVPPPVLVHEGPGAASPAPNPAAALQGDPRRGPPTPACAVPRTASQSVQHVAQLLYKPQKTWTFHTERWTRGWAEVRNAVKFQSACSAFQRNKGPSPPSHPSFRSWICRQGPAAGTRLLGLQTHSHRLRPPKTVQRGVRKTLTFLPNKEEVHRPVLFLCVLFL